MNISQRRFLRRAGPGVVGAARLLTLPNVDVATKLDTVAHHEVVDEHGLNHPAHARPFQVDLRGGVRESRAALVDLRKRASSWLRGPQCALGEGL